ncbi:hypothetical protein C4K22_0335 [Pseudomonas chlororaphis subsp. aurantiaca]|nr:hypothetical protein C4K22_0335 [Pseudomonas chlororaphis subsp. aurantiaca]AZD39440.1 hypothetical protein C4K21_0335 [Pseudomonas chlororaphis subsp. aurantiaca]
MDMASHRLSAVAGPASAARPIAAFGSGYKSPRPDVLRAPCSRWRSLRSTAQPAQNLNTPST